MIDRIGTFQKNVRSQFFVGQSQQRAFDLQTQITSGKLAQQYSGISEGASTLVNLENIREKTERYEKNIQQVQTRLNTMESYSNTILDNMITMRTSLINGLNNENANFMALAEQADSLITHTANILNSRDGNSFLFAGSRIDIPPVDLTEFDAAPDALVPDEGYYQGDDYIQSVQIDKDFNLDYGVQADDEAFENYFRVLRVIKQNPFDEEALRGTLDLLGEAINGINDIISNLGADSATLESTLSSHADIKLNLANSIGLIEDTDIVAATSQLAQEETVLQASYITISRLSRLSLAQYLN